MWHPQLTSSQVSPQVVGGGGCEGGWIIHTEPERVTLMLVVTAVSYERHRFLRLTSRVPLEHGEMKSEDSRVTVVCTAPGENSPRTSMGRAATEAAT